MESWLQEAVEACALKDCHASVHDLLDCFCGQFSVVPVAIPKVTQQAAQDWLSFRRPGQWFTTEPHSHHGLMAWWRGHGILFYNKQTKAPEQRFTVVHEVAHFVLEEWVPRRRALSVFGPEILPVLDGERAPSPEEALTLFFEQVPLNLSMDLMARDESGGYASRDIVLAEHRADRVALELLAPVEQVLPLVKQLSREAAINSLRFQFHLPMEKATEYVDGLRRRLRVSSFSIAEFLGVEEG
ncbi:ImmA/IrrE family metallo-endopeptidase [Myxococcus sp. K38C18041901]|uniref:ImmA/IrrE family metallo-endopeptidase n=1 Tax=Myxococcus guangdongensis TaxID=2906760 RepID=UPI0020A7581D|nr:ImmA/IrrE family metallo-endopeptidase [Myxococcus guangdongensis]MCP3064886.1 ImmA/IrrE family metallo-endopeptidase [Myxococcus guangdongensis]